MPDDQPGEKVAAQPMKNIPNPQPANSPPPPDSPHTQEAKAVSEQTMTTEIHGLEDRIRGAEKWMIGLTAGIVLLTAGIVIVGVLQWSAMRGQLDEMKSSGLDTGVLAQAAKLQSQGMESLANAAVFLALADQGAANAAQSAADTASDALKQSQKAFAVEQRPYLVTPAPVWVQQPATSAQTAVNVFFKNIGKAPAIKIERHFNLLRYRGLPRTDPRGGDVFVDFLQGAYHELDRAFADQSQEKYANLVRQDIAPGDQIYATVNDGGWTGIYSPLTQTEMIDLGTGNIDFYLVVKAKYTDAFKGAYETESCWYYFGTNPATWHICDAHNVIK